MPIYWIVTDCEGVRRVFLQEATNVVAARITASLHGNVGAFVEAHALDEKNARKVPKNMIGRVLSQDEATGLLV